MLAQVESVVYRNLEILWCGLNRSKSENRHEVSKTVHTEIKEVLYVMFYYKTASGLVSTCIVN